MVIQHWNIHYIHTMSCDVDSEHLGGSFFDQHNKIKRKELHTTHYYKKITLELKLYPDLGDVPGAVVDEPQSSFPLEAEALEVASVSHECPEGDTLLLARDPRSPPPLLPLIKDQASAAAPQSSSLDLLALGVALPPATEGAGAPQTSTFDLLALGVDLLPPRGGARAPQSSLFDFPALGVALPLGAELAPVAHGLLLLVAEDVPQS